MDKVEKPYLKKVIRKTVLIYNPKYGDERVCCCGHTYYRHFDSYDNMDAVGCKYCPCSTFKAMQVLVDRVEEY